MERWNDGWRNIRSRNPLFQYSIIPILHYADIFRSGLIRQDTNGKIASVSRAFDFPPVTIEVAEQERRPFGIVLYLADSRDGECLSLR
jgi:hypothetical protein